ncbi:hypothetical protein I3760_01G122200 [Carya illinoinensis]|nr:hypothetical protein I3760_01G122200 [Carya illinoinensis]KAG2726620.1 hypothetical protein I3760_01G122200 [Carya illinoinensis]
MDGDALSRLATKLAGLSTTSNAEDQPCIFKVHEQLLKVNEEAYKPVLLAIGPYNDHDKVGKGIMKKHKLRYLKQMLERRQEHSLEDYIEALRKLEVRARKCYADAECISQNKDEFVEMMLLDGCFIIELLRKLAMPVRGDEPDPIFQQGWMFAGIIRDLMLFENQLPYFVLTELFEMSASKQTPVPKPSRHSGEQIVEITSESSTSTDQVEPKPLLNLAISFFSVLFPFRDWDVDGSSSYSTKNIKHLLGQPHTTITPTLAKMVHEHLLVGVKFKKAEFKHLLDLIYTIFRLSVIDMELDRAIERQEVGVKFMMGEIFQHLFGLIRSVVSPLLEKLEKMKGYEKIIKFDGWNEDDASIPYGTELREAGVEFEMAKKFGDKFQEWKVRWESTPDAIVFQVAGIEFGEARRILWDPLVQNRNDEDKSELSGAKSKLVERFMNLLCLNKNENWDSIPHGTKFRKAGVEFEKAKKFWDTKDMVKPIPNATEVREAGVKFKAKKRTIFAINFCNGVLEISPLRIDDHTETFLQNLIAHEQCSPYIDSNYVTDYVRIFDDLIDSPKDVKLLRRKGIIENFVGTDEVASAMINKLCSQVMFSTINSIYDKTSIDMNSHCTNSWNVWMAMLWHKYFDSPWALLSLLAAMLLLGLAIIQTIFSIFY